jgi:hypothetical protein
LVGSDVPPPKSRITEFREARCDRFDQFSAVAPGPRSASGSRSPDASRIVRVIAVDEPRSARDATIPPSVKRYRSVKFWPSELSRWRSPPGSCK